MTKMDYLCLKRLQRRFHTLPLNREWLRKKLGKEGERVYGILLKGIKEGKLKRLHSVEWDVVPIDRIK